MYGGECQGGKKQQGGQDRGGGATIIGRFRRMSSGDMPDFNIAFTDVNPANPGHALAVVKEHWATLHEIPAEQLGAVAAAAQRVAGAVEKALAPAGINLIQANGPGAGQSVFHLHFHILPRAADDDLKLNWGHNPGDMDAVKAVYEKVLAAL